MSLSLAFAMLCIWCCVHDFAKDLRGISKALQARVIDSKRVYQNLMFFLFVYLSVVCLGLSGIKVYGVVCMTSQKTWEESPKLCKPE